MQITIKLDTAEFERRMESSAREIVKGLRSAVNKAAREARREFVDAAARDTGLSRGTVRGAIQFKAAGEANLTARMIVTKTRVSPLEVGAAIRRSPPNSSIALRTLLESGGNVPEVFHVFKMQTRGKSFVLTRVASAAGQKRHSTKGAKSVYVEGVGQALAHERLRPRQEWQRTAEQSLQRATEAAVQAALDGRAAPSDDGVSA